MKEEIVESPENKPFLLAPDTERSAVKNSVRSYSDDRSENDFDHETSFAASALHDKKLGFGKSTIKSHVSNPYDNIEEKQIIKE